MAYQRKDAFYARAKHAGYRSRAAYKLLELAPRYKLIQRGDRVVDLGAWPGGWLQVAAELAGPKGIVIGVDLRPIDPLPAPVTTITGDARAPAVLDQIRARADGRVNVILSDMAPALSGVRDRDIAQSVELAEVALAARTPARRGRPPAAQAVHRARERRHRRRRPGSGFQRVKLTRPEASAEGVGGAVSCLCRLSRL